MLADGVLPLLKLGKRWIIAPEAFVAAVNALAVKGAAIRLRQGTPILPPPAEKRGPGRPLTESALPRVGLQKLREERTNSP